ncbi:MAG: hypothetical protein P4L66_16065 [Acetobacteraceae bacterium]|nr:hypothetical protein [Acetobacteraceae bacterium]
MAKQSPESLSSFKTRIEDYCRRRLAPALPIEIYKPLFELIFTLIRHRQAPPRAGRGLAWRRIESASGLEGKLTPEWRQLAGPVFDSIARRSGNTEDATAVDKAQALSPARRKCAKPPRKDDIATSEKAAIERPGKPRGVRPRPIEEFPTPLFDIEEHPTEFHKALELQMRRHGDTYWSLHRAIVRPGETVWQKTISTWLQGSKVPRSVDSLEMLQRIEHRYRLPAGYFKNTLPHPARSARGFDLGDDIAPAERRRLAWHLPDDFNSRTPKQQAEILEWVRRVVISGSTEYRRYQASASKQRYAIRFPDIAYGGGPSASRLPISDDEADESERSERDPDLLLGTIDAPPHLTAEMVDLIRFKTATLTTIGLQRNGVWGEETASQKTEHFGLMFGALAAAPDGEVRGCGVKLSQLTFAMLMFPGVWDWYLQWRERRRGFFTSWEVDMLNVAQSLARQSTGWLRQHPELVGRLQAIPSLISNEEIAAARLDWDGACDRFAQHAGNRIREIERVARIHRDPFEPIMVVLEAASPLAEYRKITDEILRRMPDARRYPRPAAEAVRSCLMLRLGLHLGLRQKNLRQLRVCPRGHFPTSERRLEDMKCGELRWSERDHGWEVLIPSVAFKNANSSFFGAKPFRLILPNLLGLYEHIETYVSRHRKVLLGGANDPGTFFVKTAKITSVDASYNQITFYEAWRLTVQRYGIYNPYTGRGAIQGLLPHGPHNVRDVLATHILKQTGSYEQASYAIQDTPDMVAKHYGRFLPQDKAALAAQILNQVWLAA